MYFMNLNLLIASILIAGNGAAQAHQKENLNMDAKTVVENYFEFLQKGELEKLGNLFADSIVWHQPGQGQLSGTYAGKAELFGLFGEFMARSNGTFKIDRVNKIMVNGNWVVANLHFSATRGNMNFSMDGVDLMRVESGKITEVHLFSAEQSQEDAFWNVEN